MTTDLPTRLRQQFEPDGDIYAAADEIDRLNAENERLKNELGEALVRENNLIAENAKLRAALEEIAKDKRYPLHCAGLDCKRIARAALNEETK